jgi:hypothetical protein
LALLPLPEEVAMEIVVMAMAVMAMAETVLMAVMEIAEIVVMAETVMMEMGMKVDKPRSQTPPLMLSRLPSS